MYFLDTKPDSKLIARRLNRLIRGDVLADRTTRVLFSTDASIYRIVPAVVVQPVDLDDVVRTVLFAADVQIPVAARGAGTGLAGESLTTGIVVDFTKYMTKLEASPSHRPGVSAQPGAILDQINQRFGQEGYRFGPDPSSASRATVGGSIANNATGARSLRYGYTGEHIESLEVVLPTGKVLAINGDGKSDVAGALQAILGPNRGLIEKHWPKLKRNRAGYNLLGAMKGGTIDLIKLLAGSEGTLGIVTRATLTLVPAPKVKLMLQANFDDLLLMARSLPAILKHDPSAIELMDGTLLKLAKQAYPHLAAILPDAAASLLIEFDAEEADEARGRRTGCLTQLRRIYAGHVALREIDDGVEQSQQFEARKRAVPLLYRQDPENQPIAAIEDIAVPPGKLAEYVSDLQKIFKKHDLQATYYAHAGPGELHVRPFLDLRREAHRRLLSQITRDAYQLAWRLGGTISGEHGVGILRAWALRKQYGPVYDLMAEVKKTIDPQDIFNPGKIITEDTDLPLAPLRAAIQRTGRVIETALDFGEKDLLKLAELCNGCGECKGCGYDQLMCPIFRVENHEALSPRGRAAILREYLAGNLSDRDLCSYPANLSMDLCLLCGNCVRECPSGVDVPALVIEGRARRDALVGPRPHRMFFAHTDKVVAFSAKVGFLANRFSGNAIVKRLLRHAFNVDPAYRMPRFATAGFLRPLRRLVRKYEVDRPKVRAVWFLDLVPRYNAPDLAESFVKICARNGIQLVIPPQKPSGITELVYGRIEGARKIADYNLKHLHAALEEAEVVLCLEPTAAVSLKKEYQYLIRDERTEAVANATHDATAFLLERRRADELSTDFRPVRKSVAYHCPCHTRLLGLESPGLHLLKTIPELRVEALPGQCCGLAGTFGLQADKYELSQQIAAGLRDAIRRMRPDATCSECSSCRMQLEHVSNLPSLHPIEILAKAYA